MSNITWRENRAHYSDELTKQVARLIDLGYPEKLRISNDEFIGSAAPLAKIIHSPLSDAGETDEFPDFDKIAKSGNIPLLLVIPFCMLGTQDQMSLLQIGKKRGECHTLFPENTALWTEIDNADEIDSRRDPYLALGVGRENGSYSHDRKSCVTEEGIALIAQRPEFLEQGDSIALYGSYHLQRPMCLHNLPDHICLFELGWGHDGRASGVGEGGYVNNVTCARRLPFRF